MKTNTIRPPTSCHPFNMIEVILALVIVLLGVISLMALFPIGHNATQDAIGRNAAADAGNQFLGYFSSKVKERWALANTLPISKAGPEEANLVWQSADANQIFTGVKGLALFYNDEDNDGKFDYTITATDLSRDESGIFMLQQRTAQNLDDFSAILRVWKTPSQYNALSGAVTSSEAIPLSSGLTLNVEVSWPAHLAYDKRQKEVYQMDVFRPIVNDVDDVKGAFRITQPGKLRVTYHGSDAGWVSELWMITDPDKPEEATQIFDSNQTTDQNTVIEEDYNGQDINFYSLTHSPTYGVYKHYAWAPAPPDCTCVCRHFAGELNINPNNSTANEFRMRFPAQAQDPDVAGDEFLARGEITRDDLHNNPAHDSNGVVYHGPVNFIHVKPKGNGNQNTFLVDGGVYPLENKNTYTFQPQELDGIMVKLYNDKVKNGKCMGHWWIAVDSDCGQVLQEAQTHDLRCPKHPNNIGTTANTGNLPYYDNYLGLTNDQANFNGAYDQVSGRGYAVVIEQEPAQKWLIKFEDQPGKTTDWDYNDIVITVELFPDSGITHELGDASVEGNLLLDPNNSDDWRVSVIKADGTFLTDASLRDGAGGYSGKAVAIWMQPRGAGTQSLIVNGETITVNNDSLISIMSTDLDVNVHSLASSWKANITAANAYFTVME